jgi:hypothetical protein
VQFAGEVRAGRTKPALPTPCASNGGGRPFGLLPAVRHDSWQAAGTKALIVDYPGSWENNMSRMPPVPPDSRPTRGPDGVPKTFVDVTHLVRHRAHRPEPQASVAQRANEGPSQSKLLTLLVVGAVGYAVGSLMARR